MVTKSIHQVFERDGHSISWCEWPDGQVTLVIEAEAVEVNEDGEEEVKDTILFEGLRPDKDSAQETIDRLLGK